MINSIKIKETTESKTKKFILDKITKQKITFNLLLKLHRKSIYHNLKLLTYNNSIIILKKNSQLIHLNYHGVHL